MSWQPGRLNVQMSDGTEVKFRAAIVQREQGRGYVDVPAVDVTLGAADLPREYTAVLDVDDCRALARIFARLTADLAGPAPLADTQPSARRDR